MWGSDCKTGNYINLKSHSLIHSALYSLPSISHTPADESVQRRDRTPDQQTTTIVHVSVLTTDSTGTFSNYLFLFNFTRPNNVYTHTHVCDLLAHPPQKYAQKDSTKTSWQNLEKQNIHRSSVWSKQQKSCSFKFQDEELLRVVFDDQNKKSVEGTKWSDGE